MEEAYIKTMDHTFDLAIESLVCHIHHVPVCCGEKGSSSRSLLLILPSAQEAGFRYASRQELEIYSEPLDHYVDGRGEDAD
jgi:hypothetical protein